MNSGKYLYSGNTIKKPQSKKNTTVINICYNISFIYFIDIETSIEKYHK